MPTLNQIQIQQESGVKLACCQALNLDPVPHQSAICYMMSNY
ncbi:hypothetical protein [Dolichospermum compactum]|nr:hypothetical protein [Dolichospermum compactum]